MPAMPALRYNMDKYKIGERIDNQTIDISIQGRPPAGNGVPCRIQAGRLPVEARRFRVGQFDAWRGKSGGGRNFRHKMHESAKRAVVACVTLVVEVSAAVFRFANRVFMVQKKVVDAAHQPCVDEQGSHKE